MKRRNKSWLIAALVAAGVLAPNSEDCPMKFVGLVVEKPEEKPVERPVEKVEERPARKPRQPKK